MIRGGLADTGGEGAVDRIPARRWRRAGGLRPELHPSSMTHLTASISVSLLGIGAWILGVTDLRPSGIGNFGLLASADIWFVLGLFALLAVLR